METQEILQGIHDWTNGKIVYDISVAHPDGQGNPTPYADLAAALGTDGANIPEGLRKGGMSVKFVHSSDNKYVQYRLTNQSWSINIADWQEVGSVEFSTGEKVCEVGIDDEPTAGSDNLVKSGGVNKNLISAKDIIESFNPIDLATDFDNWENCLLSPKGSTLAGYGGHTSDFIEVSNKDVLYVNCGPSYNTSNQWANVLAYDANKNVLSQGAVLLINGTSDYVYIGINSETKYVRLSTTNVNRHFFYKISINDSIFNRINNILNNQGGNYNKGETGLILQDGSVSPSYSYLFCTRDYIPCKYGDVLFTDAEDNKSAVAGCFYDENKNLLSVINGKGYRFIPVPENAYYVRVTFRFDLNSFLYVINNDYFNPHSLYDLYKALGNKSFTYVIEDQVFEKFPSATIEFTNNIINVLSKDNAYFVFHPRYNGYANNDGYETIVLIKLKCLSITDSDTCHINMYNVRTINYDVKIGDTVTFYYSLTQRDGDWIQVNQISSWELVDTISVVIPKYFRDELFTYFTYYVSAIDFKENPLLEFDSINKYRNLGIPPQLSLHSRTSKEAFKLKNFNPYFKGKTYCSFGTSITEGGSASDYYPYPRWIGGYFNMKVCNIGKSSTRAYGPNGNIRTELLAMMPEDTMLVSMLDAANGWITDDIDSVDTNTSVGAYNVAIAYIKEHYPAATIVIGPDFPTEQAIKDLKALAEKNHVLYANTENVATCAAMRTDGVHPNRLGNLMICAAIINAAENSILQTYIDIPDDDYTIIRW